MSNLRDNKRVQIVVFGGLILLLFLALIVILMMDKTAKSETSIMMKEFNESMSGDDYSLIYYYGNSDEDNNSELELDIVRTISKDYDINVVLLDKTKLNSKNRNKIENELGIEDNVITLAVVKEGKIKGLKTKFTEGNRLVDIMIETEMLPKDAKYSRTSEINFITYEQYKEKIKSKDKTIVVIGKTGCKYCISEKDILNNIARAYKVEINYIDISELDKDDFTELFDLLPEKGYNDRALETEGTFDMPTTLVYEKDKIISFEQGYKELEELVKYFKSEELIK